MNDGKLLVNKIRTPDGKILVSRSVHDYRVYTDANGLQYMVDGGLDYIRRNVNRDAPEEELSLYDTDPHEKIREEFDWGTYGEYGDQPLQYKLLKDLDHKHIEAIIRTQPLRECVIQMFKNELEFRKSV